MLLLWIWFTFWLIIFLFPIIDYVFLKHLVIPFPLPDLSWCNPGPQLCVAPPRSPSCQSGPSTVLRWPAMWWKPGSAPRSRQASGLKQPESPCWWSYRCCLPARSLKIDGEDELEKKKNFFFCNAFLMLNHMVTSHIDESLWHRVWHDFIHFYFANVNSLASCSKKMLLSINQSTIFIWHTIQNWNVV